MMGFKFRKRIPNIYGLTVLVVLFCANFVHCGMGYFWHVSDLHLDLEYNPSEWHCLNTFSSSKTILGEHGCDSPWVLADSALNAMKKLKSTEDLEFILWTGDSLTEASRNISKARSIEIVRNATMLFRKYFDFFFVYPAIGHTDLPLQNTSLFSYFADMWYQWLPVEAIETLQIGGYYSIEQKYRQLRIVILNSNLMMLENDVFGQWIWLETILKNAQPNGETIYLVGHIPPGFVELGPDYAPKCVLPDEQNTRFVDLISRYSDVIVGQFYGHLHSDTFRTFYNSKGRLLTHAFISPSVTPKDGTNPAVRLYHFDSDTGKISDYKQYYLDLNDINLRGEPHWSLEYELKSYYNMSEVSSEELHAFKEKWLHINSSLHFEKYLTAYNVKGTVPQCGSNTAWRHYCAVSYVEKVGYNLCLFEKRSYFNCPSFSMNINIRPELVAESGVTRILLSSYLAFIFRVYMAAFAYIFNLQYIDSRAAIYLLCSLIVIAIILNPDRFAYSCCRF